MKKIIHNLTYYVSLAITIGLLISLAFSYAYHCSEYLPSSPEFVRHFSTPLAAVAVSILLWAVIGLLWGTGALLFKVSRWSLLKRTIIHFIVTYAGLLILGSLAGWFAMNLASWLIFTLIFFFIYLAVWAINRKLIKNQIRQINRKLQK